MRLPNIMPVKHLPQPIHGLISSVLPSNALLANSLSQIFALPIIHISHFPLAINSSAIHGSLIRATVATGILIYFLISSLEWAWGAGLVPGAGILEPRFIVFPPETWIKSTPIFSNCLQKYIWSLSVKPPSLYSSPEIRTSIIKSSPQYLRTDCITSKQRRIRPLISPPYSSVLLLYNGVKNPPNKPCAWAHWISTPSPPANCTRWAAWPNCSTIVCNSSIVAGLGALFA